MIILKKFSFTLQTLLDVNLSIEKEQKNRLAITNNKIQTLEAEHELKLTEIESSISTYVTMMKEMSPVNQIINQSNYLKHLNNQLTSLHKAIEQQYEEKKIIQAMLVETITKCKSLDKLKGKHYKLYSEDVKKEDEKSIEEVTYNIYTQPVL